MGKPEGLVENYLIRKCKKYGFWCKKFVSPGTSGVPDRIVIADGDVLFIELKRESGGKVSELQKLCIDEINKAGGTAIVCAGKAAVDAVLEPYIKRHLAQCGRENP